MTNSVAMKEKVQSQLIYTKKEVSELAYGHPSSEVRIAAHVALNSMDKRKDGFIYAPLYQKKLAEVVKTHLIK